jgi:predicted O-methyltransferase YrrM
MTAQSSSGKRRGSTAGGEAQPEWVAVERHAEARLVPGDRALEGALARSEAAGLPGINVTASMGRFLHLLARIAGARRILEIGTLGAYSTIWLARALPPGGRVITIEVDPAVAETARANLAGAGLTGVVDLRVGRALDELPRIEAEGGGPFDMVFVDADKPSTPHYLEWAVRLSRPGSVIIIDNVVRAGALADEANDDPRVVAMRQVVEAISRNPRLTATLMQTVGSKGYDGFITALVGVTP